MTKFLILLAIVAVVVVLWIRIAPSRPDVWHVDPQAVGQTSAGGFYLSPQDSPLYDATPEAILIAVSDVADETPRTMQLAGSPDEGRMTFVTRSKAMAFPDYTTVQAIENEDGTRLAIYARLRFGRSDFGVNEARVRAWLKALEPLIKS